MSAQGRISTEREPRDFYPTPLSAFLPLLKFLPRNVPIWEPACGDRRLVLAMVQNDFYADGADIAEGCDFFDDEGPHQCLVTNPPFSLAFDFCKHAAEISEEFFFLLPMGFLASAKRKEWFQANEPSALFVLSERPSFVMVGTCALYSKFGCDYREILPVGSPRPRECKKCGARVKITTTDACDYAWIYWGPRHAGIFHL